MNLPTTPIYQHVEEVKRAIYVASGISPRHVYLGAWADRILVDELKVLRREGYNSTSSLTTMHNRSLLNMTVHVLPDAPQNFVYVSIQPLL